MLVSSPSSDLLCDLYYPLLGELTGLEHKVISFETQPKRKISRINQFSPLQHEELPDDASHVFIDWQSVRDAELLNHLLSTYHTATVFVQAAGFCLLYTSPSPRDGLLSRMPSSA